MDDHAKAEIFDFQLIARSDMVDEHRDPAPDPRKNPNYWEQQAEHIAVELFIHSDVNEILSRLVVTAGRNNAKILRKLNKIVKDE